MTDTKKKVLLGMSGGVDSAFAAKILLDSGYDVFGVILQMHENCDIDGAKSIASDMGIPLDVYDCREAFQNIVVEDFVREYSNGRTPNPCILCNRTVKFHCLLEYAEKNGFDYIATGHYAGIVRDKDTNRLTVKRGSDPKKDQSYMLWQLGQEQLEKIIFPLENFYKNDVKSEMLSINSDLANKAESQEICFIDGNYADFIEARVGKFPKGNFVDESGKIYGEHNGIIHYTVGQRKGLGFAAGEPMFIRRIDAHKNEIIVGKSGEEFENGFSCDSLRFMALPESDSFSGEFYVKIRYAAPPAKCFVAVENGVASVRLETPVRAVTPGQSAVFYKGENIAFGGLIR